MSKLGHHDDKIILANTLRDMLAIYYIAPYRPNTIDFKIIFEIIDANYFKIINKVSNIGAPGIQHMYKKTMCDLFKYILPHGNYEIITDNNAFLKIRALDPNKIMKDFKDLVYSYKQLKFKETHTYSASMSLDEFRKFIIKLLNVNESDMIKNISSAEDFF